MKTSNYFIYCLFFVLVLLTKLGNAYSQNSDLLLLNNQVRIECTEAIDDLYNFKYEKAEQQFRWLRQYYPEHPMPYFLFALSERWKILPNLENTSYDKSCLLYLDTAIEKAEKILDKDEKNIEAVFFLAASHGFVGWLQSERKNWGKATNAARHAVHYMEKNLGNEEFSPEFLFGEGLYNFYVEWVPENYPMLRMVTAFFPDGDKEKGIQQLETVVKNAFYTRVEALYFLTRIYAFETNQEPKALELCKMLLQEYPDNAYFHRLYARLLYNTGNWTELLPVTRSLLKNVENKMPGYEENSGRYAGFFLGIYMKEKISNNDSALYFFQKAVDYSRNIDATQMGYYLYSLYYMAQIYDLRGDTQKALAKYEEIIGDGSRKHFTVQEAKKRIKVLKKQKKKDNKRAKK